jgi:hypothetical protein
MIYQSVSSAVVSALAAEAKSGAKGQAWQKLYSSVEEEGGDISTLARGSDGSLDRDQVDYWIAARLHHLLTPRHWHALVAKYSTHKGKKVEAISLLRAVIATPAPAIFLYKAVTAWAIPKLPGARPKRATSVSVEIPLDAPDWRREAMVSAAVAAGKARLRTAESRSADMIVLPDSFYDMNTWDLDAAGESTRRRWRAGINEKLNGIIDEALAHAEQILRTEGVLSDVAA